jgi:uncharacterized protein YcbX
MTGARISRISVAPIKGFALSHPNQIDLTRAGARGDREFFLIDDQGSLVSITKTGAFAAFHPDYNHATNELAVTAPDGSDIRGTVSLGDLVDADFWGNRLTPARLVLGPWTEWFSDIAGQHLRLVKAVTPSGGIDVEPVTMLGVNTVKALSDYSELEDLDDRRFRMLLTFSGTAAHTEDSWMDADFWIGSSRIRVNGLVRRCAAVTRHPQTGERDLPLLRMMKRHRGLQESSLGAGVCLGVYAKVIVPGSVRTGDEIVAAD